MIKKLLSTMLLLSISGQLQCKRTKHTDDLIQQRVPTHETTPDLKKQSAPIAESVLDTKIKWPDICSKYKNSVVQIYSYVNVFNLSDPSKTGSEQYIVAGTGFFISDDGYLLTNFHVISEAPVVEVRFPALGDQSFEVKIVGCFPEKDFALLKINSPVFLIAIHSNIFYRHCICLTQRTSCHY